MAEFSIVGPSNAKRPKVEVIDNKKCIFCHKAFETASEVVSPDLNKLTGLFEACLQRNDDIGKLLLQYKEDIQNREVNFKYHRDCRATYVSPLHIKRYIQKQGQHVADNNNNNTVVAAGSSTRSQCPDFDWKMNCFICGTRCNPKHNKTWSMVTTSINASSRNMYTQVLEAALKRNDTVMLTRLRGVANGDLVAVEARYHRIKNCVPHYISDRNIAAIDQLSKQEHIFSSMLSKLASEYLPALKDGEVFLLTSMRNRFQELLCGQGAVNSENYTSQNLKKQLLKQYSEILSFIPQPGSKSDLVCSSTIRVGEALQKANQLAQVLRSIEDDDENNDSSDHNYVSDDSIIHQAVGILRRRIISKKETFLEYYSPDETSLKSQKAFVEPLLYKALGWLVYPKQYADASDLSDKPPDKRCVSIACDIMTLVTLTPSPKHQGLAIELYHKFGSKKLIDIISQKGHCMSYTEIRKFTTSAAIHVSSLQTPTPVGAHMPPDAVHRDKGGGFLIAAADNWDHNERTIDGKRTTHAMTSILVQPKNVVMETVRIPRGSSRTLNINTIPGM